MSAEEWYGVDFDGTLAFYWGWDGPLKFGAPVPAMLERVKAWIAQGLRVKIFTARVSEPDPLARTQVELAIQQWCVSHGLPALEVTCTKDFRMPELWDDRAVTVEANTGRALAPSSRGLR
jgi:hypothetical protein